MNKTLLLILVDFLLLNLLALARWEEPPERAADAKASPAQSMQQVVDEDLVDTLRVSLEEQAAERDQLGERLQETESELSEREQAIAERERRLAEMQAELERKAAEAVQLSDRVETSQSVVAEMSDRLARAAEEAARSRAQSEQLGRELAERQTAAAALDAQVKQLAQEKEQAQTKIQTLSTQMQVAETEKTFLRESVDTLRGQVDLEREEKLKIQEQTGVLAEGVTQLAQSSSNLREEIRSNTPINANTLFDQFLSNRIAATFVAQRRVFLGTSNDETAPRTILVSDGTNTLALFHVNDTVAQLRENPPDWQSISGTLRGSGNSLPIHRLLFLAADPRVAIVTVTEAEAAALGAKVYLTALEPFKFPEAVIVGGGGKYYGEVEFKLDPQTPGYVRMQNRVFNRMFGEFSPSVGDLVFSKTGEILGVMVNNRYCALLQNFTPRGELFFDENLPDRQTENVLKQQWARVQRLPQRLQ